jgi:hypothetical protein
MSALIQAFAAAARAATSPFQIRVRLRAILPLLALLLAGCAEPPRSPTAGPNPADPGARAPAVDYRPTTGSYKSRRPVDPAPWGEQNERVAPQPKSGQ